MAEFIKIAKIAGAHGVKGLVKLAVFLEDPKDIENYNPLQNDKAESFSITLKNSTGKFWLAEINGINDRDKAEALNGTILYIPRGAMPKIEESEFYHADLVGLQVEDTKGNIVGTVRSIQNFGAGDLLDIGNKLMLPLHKQYYDEIDAAKGVIKINEAAEELIEIIKS